MKKLVSIFVMAVTAMLPAMAQTSHWPERTVRIVVPSGAGGGLDVVARIVARRLETQWKHGVIVENRPGNNAMIGTNAVLEATADGHTLLFYSFTAYAAARNVAAKDSFDWAKHLEPLSHMTVPPFVLVVNANRQAKSLNELADQGRARGLTYGSTAAGSPLHMYGAISAAKMEVNGIQVPYKSVPQIVVDILNGQLDYAVLNWSTVSQHVQNRTMTPLFVFDNRRLAAHPELPTLLSPGMSEYRTLLHSYNFFVRRDTPTTVVNQIKKDIDTAVRQSLPELTQKQLIGGANDLDPADVQAVNQLFMEVGTKIAK